MLTYAHCPRFDYMHSKLCKTTKVSERSRSRERSRIRPSKDEGTAA